MINVTIGESKTQEVKPFPKLMKQLDTGWIMYFLDEKTCIHISHPHYSVITDYNADKYTVDYNEPITLQNA